MYKTLRQKSIILIIYPRMSGSGVTLTIEFLLRLLVALSSSGQGNPPWSFKSLLQP